MKNIELDVKKIICKILKNKKIDWENSLYQNGIDSLNMLLIVTEIENHFKITIPYEDLLISNFETVGQICRLIAKIKEAE